MAMNTKGALFGQEEAETKRGPIGYIVVACVAICGIVAIWAVVVPKFIPQRQRPRRERASSASAGLVTVARAESTWCRQPSVVCAPRRRGGN